MRIAHCGTVKDGRVIARGSSDNKGKLPPHLFGVEHAIRQKNLPVNVISMSQSKP
jgi:acetylornithine deacetylase/succinyl-diaminopimelate desuccinylase-like protein